MNIITVIAQQISPEALTAALPAEGVISVTVSQTQAFTPAPTAVESYRGRKMPQHFQTVLRIEVVVEDAAAEKVLDGIAFARSVGLLGEAQAWVSERAARSPFSTGSTPMSRSA